jgi:Arc/MetJ family transcription regulator
MGQRVNFYLDDDLIEALNQHTQVSPLSRSEIVAIALRRLLRDERRRVHVDVPATEMSRRIAAGELPSRRAPAPRAAPSLGELTRPGFGARPPRV